MLEAALLSAILASQWVLASKAGVKYEEFTAAIARGILPSDQNANILPFTRKVIDLTLARKLEDQNVSGSYICIESCTGTDVQAFLNLKDIAMPTPIYLDKLDHLYYPFSKLYITNAAQPGKEITLLFGRAAASMSPGYLSALSQILAQLVTINTSIGAAAVAIIAAMPVIPAFPIPSMYRWNIPREPVWVDGAPGTPAAGGVLVTQTVTAALTGRVFGIHISADEGNQFDLCLDGTAVNHYVLAAGGTLDIVLASPIQDGLVAAVIVTIEVVLAGTGTTVYQASLLYDEA